MSDDYTDARIESVADSAQEAFWDRVAESFPEITSGDFGPTATILFDNACRHAIAEWLRFNTAESVVVGTIDGTDDNTPRETGVPIWDDDDTDPPTTFSFDTVADLLRAAGVPNIIIEQTGGGTATLYGGPVAIWPGSERDSDDRYGEYHQFALGPGFFNGPGWTKAEGYISEACFGPDDDGQSDDYRMVEDVIANRPGWPVEQAVATAIIEWLGGQS